MSAEPARRVVHRQPERSSVPRRAPSQDDRVRKRERRRRAWHFRRRRRDLLEDTAVALMLTIALVSVTAGLGVLALIEMPLTAALLASLFAERAIRRRRPRNRRSGP